MTTTPTPTPTIDLHFADNRTLLLIAPEAASLRVADALRRELDLTLDLAPNRRLGLAMLRRSEYTLVLLEENLAADSDAVDTLYQNAGAAPIVEINFAIAGVERIVRQVKSALARRTQDHARARTAAAAALQSELNASLTGLLLESQLALREAPPPQQPKLRHVVALASELRERLRTH